MNGWSHVESGPLMHPLQLGADSVLSTGSASGKAAAAATWLVGGRLLARLIDLATLLVLARVLGPTEFGIVSLAMTPIYIVEAVTDLPIAQGLLRVPVLTPSHLDTAFTLSMLRGCCISLIAILISVPFAKFGEDSRLVPLICVLSLASVIRSLGSQAMIVFIRRIDFRRDFCIDLVGRLVTFVTAVSVAVLTRSYWAIAAGTMTGPVVTTVLSYALAPHRPRLMIREWQIFSNLVGWHSCTQALVAINWQFDRLLLSRFVLPAEFGRYSVSDNLAAMPQQVLIGPLLRAWLPSFARLQEDPERLRQAYKKASAATVLIGAPAFVGMAVLARPAVLIALGTKWTQAAPLLTWLALAGILVLPLGPLESVAIRLGRAQFITLQAAIEFSVKVPLLIVAIAYEGVMGAVLARFALSIVSGFAGMYVMKGLVGLPVSEQLRVPLRFLFAAATMGVCLVPAARFLDPLPLGLTLIAGTAAAILLGGVIYAVTVVVLWTMTGRPAGPEEILLDKLRSIVKRDGVRRVLRSANLI